MTVNNQNLSVVTIVVMGGNKRLNRSENLAPYPKLFYSLRVVQGQKRQFTGAVIHKSYIHALCRFSGENFQYFPPHGSLVKNKVLEENKAFGLFKPDKQLSELVLSQGKISNRGIFINGVTAASFHVA